jgi:hypothetical protein
MIYLLTATGSTPGGSSTVHIYTQTIHRTTQSMQTIHRITQLTNWEECGLCPAFASYTLAFALQLRKKHGKPSVRVAEECQLARWKQNTQKRAYITIRIHNLQNQIKIYKTYNHIHNDKKRTKLYNSDWNLVMIFRILPFLLITILTYLLTAIGLSPGGSTHLHTNNT